MRVPVSLRRSVWVPDGFAAWVPCKRTILVRVGHPVTPRLIAHELAHVLQAERHAWPWAYVRQWAATGFSYTNMPFEVEARAAERDETMLAWARDVLAGFEA